MDTKLLEEILACPTLPSLPAIAVQVIELTSDPNVSMDDLADLIQTDQAMSARILRTVNSSFYGLRERCTTIKKALVMLGLSPVKSLALGFSLVSSLDQNRQPTFDYVSYWRRGLFTAAAAKSVADAARLPEADECFISGLLQDIGMMAMLQTLGEHYIRVVDSTGGDHAALAKAEIAAYEAQHADIGATLATRWRLPDELTIPIKYHERPTAAPDEHAVIAKVVAIGNLAHDIATSDNPAPLLKRYYQRCKSWLNLSEDQADEAFRRFSQGTAELSDLFNLDTGPGVDAEGLLEQASEQLVKIAETETRAPHADKLHGLLQNEEGTDPLTGLPNAQGFARAVDRLFNRCATDKQPISLVQVVIDGLNTVSEAGGILASDAVFIRAVAFLQQQFEPMGGVVCRVGAGIIGVILPGTRENQVIAAVNQFRAQFDAALPSVLQRVGVPADRVSTSIGLATADEQTFAQIKRSKSLTAAATKAAVSAREAGGNCLRTFTIQRAA